MKAVHYSRMYSSELCMKRCVTVGMMGMMPMMRPPGMMPGMIPPGVAMPPFHPPSSQVSSNYFIMIFSTFLMNNFLFGLLHCPYFD